MNQNLEVELRQKLDYAAEDVQVGGTYHLFSNPEKLFKVAQLAIAEGSAQVVVFLDSLSDEGNQIKEPFNEFVREVKTNEGLKARYILSDSTKS